MKKFKMLLILSALIFVSCQAPNLSDCSYNFAADILRGVEYRECNKHELIEDFEDFIYYIKSLENSGEFHNEMPGGGMPINSVPTKLLRADRIFCSRGCSATHWIRELCFTWADAERFSFQRIERLSEVEAKKKPECRDAYRAVSERNKESGRFYDWDWKNTEKYKKWRAGDWGFAGSTIWESL